MKKYRVTSIPQSLPKARNGFEMQPNWEDRLSGLLLSSINEKKQMEQRQKDFEDYNTYIDNYTKANKKDKILPQYTIPKKDLSGSSFEFDKEGKAISNLDLAKRTHYVQENKDGTYSLWPLEVMADRIVQKGFFNNEFDQYWGLDPKQVKEQLGDAQQEARDAYEAQTTFDIYNKAIKEGKDVSTVIKELPESKGRTESMLRRFTKPVSDIIDETYKEVTKNYLDIEKDAAEQVPRYDINKEFDFGSTSGVQTIKDEEGEEHKVWSITGNLDKEYEEWYINQGKTSEEKAKRRNDLNRLRKKVGKGFNPYDLEGSKKIGMLHDWVGDQERQYKVTDETLDEIKDQRTIREQEQEDWKNYVKELEGTVGFDQMSHIPSKILDDKWFSEKVGEKEAWKEDILGQYRADVNELTEKDDNYIRYMNQIAGVDEDRLNLLKQAYDSKYITQADKASLLGEFEKLSDPSTMESANPYKVSGEDLFQHTNLSKDYERLYSPERLKDYLWTLPKYENMKHGEGFFEQGPPLEWYDKTWDVMTNPGDALAYWIDPDEEMWPASFRNQGTSYNQRIEAERRGSSYETPTGYETDFDNMSYQKMAMNSLKNAVKGAYDPKTLLDPRHGLAGLAGGLKYFNSLNPFNYGDEMYRADDKLQRFGELNLDAALDAASIISLGGSQALKLGLKGAKAANAARKLNKFKKFMDALKFDQSTGLGRYGSRFVKNYTTLASPMYAYDAFRPGGDFSKAFTNFSEGNIGSGLADFGWGTLGLGFPLRQIKRTAPLVKAAYIPGDIGIYKPASKYGFRYANPHTGSRFFYGDPEILKSGRSLFPKTSKNIRNKGILFDLKKTSKPKPKHNNFSFKRVFNKEGGSVELPKADKGLITKGLKQLSNVTSKASKAAKEASKVNKTYVPNPKKVPIRNLNKYTFGTLDSLAKIAAPVVMNPVRALVLGHPIEGAGPFTGSPLNVLPFYGKRYPTSHKDRAGAAFRKMGNSLDWVKNTGIISPAHGANLRIGKNQIIGEGNWAEPGFINEKYPGTFMVAFDPWASGSNMQVNRLDKRDGVLINEGPDRPFNSIMDPGVTFHRRLPFSNRYIPINMDKLRKDETDWRTMGGHFQSLLERLGYLGAGAAGLAYLGVDNPVDDFYNENIYEPVESLIEKGKEYMKFGKKKKGGMVVELDENQINEYAKNGWIIEDV